MSPTSTKRRHPARTLIIFVLVVLGLYGSMAAMKAWTPKLGLDLRGGTTITLTARNETGAGAPSGESMELARQIIQRRVDSLGVGEAAVTISGDRQIVIAVPNVNQDTLVRLVGQTAQLRFRPVIAQQPAAAQAPAPTTTTTPQATGTPAATAQPTGSTTPAASPTGAKRPMDLPTAPPTQRPQTSTATEPVPIATALAYQPTQQDIEDYQNYRCGDPFPDLLDQPLITCDKAGQAKYFLGPVVQLGSDVSSAQAGIPQQGIQWQVNLGFNDRGTKQWSDITTAMYTQQSPMNQLGIVLDGRVISAPTINEPITGGQAMISGNFNQQSATELANVLKYGALPLTFDTSSVDNVSATLGEEQLKAGLIAGLIGLALVILYAFLYYRGLGVVVVASLAIAALLTYALLVLLGQSLDLALNLPGIAGAIVAIGITADSFIIYFERIRDEVREGRSLRAAIETGWDKAKSTIVIADMVSVLSAVVLFFLAIGAVQGFAFTLGLTTVIDLAIIFWWTKPLMSLLGRTRFFGEGHRWSGLDPEHMGVERVAATRAAFRRTKSSTPRKTTKATTVDSTTEEDAK